MVDRNETREGKNEQGVRKGTENEGICEENRVRKNEGERKPGRR